MYSYFIKGAYWVGDTSLQELSNPTVTGCLLKTENLIVVSLWNQMAQELQTGARVWRFLGSWLCWVHTEKLKTLEFNVCGWWLQPYSYLLRNNSAYMHTFPLLTPLLPAYWMVPPTLRVGLSPQWPPHVSLPPAPGNTSTITHPMSELLCLDIILCRQVDTWYQASHWP